MATKVSRRELARVFTEKLLAQPKNSQRLIQVLAAYIVEHKLQKQVDALLNDIAHELYVQSGNLTVEVVSVEKLAESTKASIADFLKAQTGAATVTLHESTDTELLGGIIARTPDAELDASVVSKLRKLAALA